MFDFTSNTFRRENAFLRSSIATKLQIAKSWSEYLGASCFPVKGKKPNFRASWKAYTTSPQVYEDKKAWQDATGFAIAPVQGSDFFILDVDCPDFAQRLFQRIPILEKSLRVCRGQNLHIYLKLPSPEDLRSIHSKKSTKGELASLRGSGAYVVGPYSLHLDSHDTYLPQITHQSKIDIPEEKQNLKGEEASIEEHLICNAFWGEFYSESDLYYDDFEDENAQEVLQMPELVYIDGQYHRMNELFDDLPSNDHPNVISSTQTTENQNAHLLFWEAFSEESIKEHDTYKLPEIKRLSLEEQQRLFEALSKSSQALQTVRPPHSTSSIQRTKKSKIRTARHQSLEKHNSNSQRRSLCAVSERVMPTPKTLEHLLMGIQTAGFSHTGGSWLKGSCLYAKEHHKDGVDRNPSAVYDSSSGVYHCFVCGSRSPKELSYTLGIPYRGICPSNEARENKRKHQNSGRYAFNGILENPTKSMNGVLSCEWNILSALFREGQAGAARMFVLLWDLSRRHHGQHTFTWKELLQTYLDTKLSESQYNNDLKKSISIGLICKKSDGTYKRTGLKAVKELLGLESNCFAQGVIDRNIVQHLKHFRALTLLAIQNYLVEGLASETIARASGLSRRTLYRYENAMKVRRTQVFREVALAPATQQQPQSFHFVQHQTDAFVSIQSKSQHSQTPRVPTSSIRTFQTSEAENCMVGITQLPSERELPCFQKAQATILRGQ